jgi:hypothetical protein
MKKLMSILLGLSLVIGTAAISFADEKKEEKKESKKKGKKKKGGDDEKKQ